MNDSALIESPDEETLDPDAEQQETQEVPSVFSVTTRYLIGAADVSPVAEDGSRVLRLFSASGQAVVEANLAPEICNFISTKLAEIEIIEEADENAKPEE